MLLELLLLRDRVFGLGELILPNLPLCGVSKRLMVLRENGCYEILCRFVHSFFRALGNQHKWTNHA